MSAENGNYFGTLELLAQYDDFLNQHIQKLVKPGLYFERKSTPYTQTILRRTWGACGTAKCENYAKCENC